MRLVLKNNVFAKLAYKNYVKPGAYMIFAAIRFKILIASSIKKPKTLYWKNI